MAQIFGTGSGDMAADRRFAIASDLAKEGNHLAAADLYAQGLEIAPHWPPLHFHHAKALTKAGQPEAAISSYQAYLTLDPRDHMGAGIRLSLLGQGPEPDKLPASYVQSLFDEYAPRFDNALVNNLKYEPERLADLVRNYAPGRFFPAMLDLGCGTGLALQALKDICGHKTGIDLSPAMVRLAREKLLYDELQATSLEEFLQNTSDRYDLILCADVFVYVGALEQAFALIANAMNKDALFAVSVQHLESGDWSLGTDHRYAHSVEYIKACARSCGLHIADEKQLVLRKDGGRDINGRIILCHNE